MTDSPFPRRRDGLIGALGDADAYLVSRPANVFYLTGFTGSSAYLILTKAGRCVLVSDTRYETQIGEECPDVEAAIRGHDSTTPAKAAEALTGLGVGSAAFEADDLTVAALDRFKGLAPSVDWVPRAGDVGRLRAVKDDAELAAILEAIDFAERAFVGVHSLLRGRDTERDIAADVESAIRRLGGTGVSFEVIAAVGDRSALPHAPPTGRRAEESPVMLLDWGALCRNGRYASDMTRLLPTPAGRAVDDRWRSLYTTVLAAQKAAAAEVRDGADVKVIDRAARKVIEDAGFGDKFTHGLGHGLGLDVHEAPSVRSNSDDVLRAGMVITLEPGIYLPGFGGVRIEDDFLVTADGRERLTTLPQEWDEFFDE